MADKIFELLGMNRTDTQTFSIRLNEKALDSIKGLSEEDAKKIKYSLEDYLINKNKIKPENYIR